MSEIQRIAHPDGHELAFSYTQGEGPAVVFLSGYRSDMNGTKATMLEEYCTAVGQAFLRFDYRGHGQSGGEFIEATGSDWLSDTLFMLDKVLQGTPVILIGSSMGGHLMVRAALERQEQVKAMIGLAAAVDFTEKLMWARGTEERRAELKEKGVIYLPSEYSDEPYPITMKFIEDGRKAILLDDMIPLQIPVHLIHGILDDDVPWDFSLALCAQLESMDVEVTLVKDGDHRLSRPEDIVRICIALDRLSDKINEASLNPGDFA
ncbi:MAG: alpha/beta hydrolase [Rickettsiales bacterium]|nr:alpha/beta hydrolase [Rickettsiales bacterium]|tara:strand:+ start:313 stop:1101 length:789 start_codon:yes stop_codon:yes gene_type:complete